MQPTCRYVARAALAVVVLSCLFAVSGCGLEDMLKGEVSEFEEVVPQGNGEINGFLSGIGSDKRVDAEGAVHAVRLVGVRWDVGTSDSEFVLTPDTAVVVNSRDLSSATTTDKAAALARLDLDGSTTPVYVRYQTTPRPPDEDELQNRYPIALRIEVTSAK